VADASAPQQVATHKYTIVISNKYTVTFQVQPSNTEANHPITPPVKVKVTDSKGKAVKGATLTASLAVNPGGGTLKGTTATTAADGTATFNNQSINKVGNGYQLLVTVTNPAGGGSATSKSFNITDEVK
jgi:hypothetical protein